MITASSLSRLMNCPASSVLARAENASEWADLGNEEHEALSHLDNLPDDLACLVPAGSRSEVKLAFDVVLRTGRIIGEGAGRNYGEPGPNEIVGSTDFVGIDGDAVIVGDWKTGFHDVEPAATNPQLAFYALAAARALNKNRAVVRIIYTKTGRVDEAELDALDMASFAGQLESLHRRVAAARSAQEGGAIADTREGSWCRYCNSKPYCGSKVGLLVQVAAGGLAVIGDTAMTPERASAAYEQIVRIDQLVKDAKKRLDTYVTEQGPIDLGEGRMYGRYKRKGNERLDGAVALKAIREVLGEQAPAFEAIAIGYDTSKAAIDRAAKQLIAKGATKVAKAVVEKVRELGGVSSSPTFPVGEFFRDKDEPAVAPPIDIDDMDRRLREVG